MAKEYNLLQSLTDSIIQTCKTLINKADYDMTYNGRIVAIIDAAKYKYKVSFNGSEHTCTGMCKMSVGDFVYITVCKNDYKHIIADKPH